MTMTARRPVPAVVFLPVEPEPAPVIPAGWWRSDKTLVLDFLSPPAEPVVHDDEEYRS